MAVRTAKKAMMSVLVTEKGMPRNLSQPSWKGTSSALSPPSTLAISGFITRLGCDGGSAGRATGSAAQRALPRQHALPGYHIVLQMACCTSEFIQVLHRCEQFAEASNVTEHQLARIDTR